MLILNVTVKVEFSVHDTWLHWMRSEHIPDVLRVGIFYECRLFRIETFQGDDGVTYAVQYTCNNRDDLERYERDYAPALRAKHQALFEKSTVAFRTCLEHVETFAS